MFGNDTLLFLTHSHSVAEMGRGAYGKKVLVLTLSEPDSPGNRAFLEKILAAAGLELAQDTLLVEVPIGMPLNCFASLAVPPEAVLVFGLPPAQIGLTALTTPYQVCHLNRCHWLFADALSVLEPNRDKKGQLWLALKSLFVRT